MRKCNEVGEVEMVFDKMKHGTSGRKIGSYKEIHVNETSFVDSNLSRASCEVGFSATTIENSEENDYSRQKVPCCATCQSTYGCEEDVDNPGAFYCQTCWEEYENSLGTS
mmetsp:Transcript_6883/g.9205  ORF Transcript_6883/g.9205 Transcript_6883/m.9205 type:complete len:110 (+) Transcript_6883:1-330(+)